MLIGYRVNASQAADVNLLSSYSHHSRHVSSRVFVLTYCSM